MRPTTTIWLASVLFAVVVYSEAAAADEAGELLEYFSWWEGEWTVETRQADEVETRRLTVERHAPACHVVKTDQTIAVWGYHPGLEQWVGNGFRSDGTRMTTSIDRPEGKRITAGTVHTSTATYWNPDGSEVHSKSTWSYEDENTVKIRETQMAADGSALPDVVTICRRVSQSNREDHALAFQQFAGFMVGNWSPASQHDPDGPIKHVYSWTLGKKFVRSNGALDPMPFDGFIGIDPRSKRLTWWGFLDDGTAHPIYLTDSSDDHWVFQGDQAGPDGNVLRRLMIRKTGAAALIARLEDVQGETPTVVREEAAWVRHRQPSAASPASSSPAELNRKQLEPLSFLIGQWQGDYQLPAAIPEIGAVKGDTLVHYIATDWILDGAAIEMNVRTSVNGTQLPDSKELIVWDPGNDRLAQVIVGGNGFFGGGTWRHENGHWMLDWRDAGSDSQYAATSIYRLDPGAGYSLKIVDVKRNNDPLPDWPWITFRRVDRLHEQWLDYMEGTWKFTSADGRSGICTYARRGPTTLGLEASCEQFSIVGMVGWHEDEGMLVETDYTHDKGTQSSLYREFSEITPELISGFQTSHNASRMRQQALGYRRISDNEMHLVGRAADSEGDWSVEVRFVRQR